MNWQDGVNSNGLGDLGRHRLKKKPPAPATMKPLPSDSAAGAPMVPVRDDLTKKILLFSGIAVAGALVFYFLQKGRK